MERLAKNIAANIGETFQYSSEKTAVISYGLTAIFQMLIISLAVSLIGFIGGFWAEGIIIFLLVGLLRKSIGGAHSETFTGCVIYSVFFISLMAFLSHYLINPNLLFNYIAFSGLSFVFSCLVVYKRAPVDSPNKPIRKKEKIRSLRINAFITLTIYFIVVAILYYLSEKDLRFSGYAMSITMAVLWQTFMLTESGHILMQVIDRKMVDF